MAYFLFEEDIQQQLLPAKNCRPIELSEPRIILRLYHHDALSLLVGLHPARCPLRHRPQRPSPLLDRRMAARAICVSIFYVVAPTTITRQAIASLALWKEYRRLLNLISPERKLRNNHIITDNTEKLLGDHGVLAFEIHHHVFLNPYCIYCSFYHDLLLFV